MYKTKHYIILVQNKNLYLVSFLPIKLYAKLNYKKNVIRFVNINSRYKFIRFIFLVLLDMGVACLKKPKNMDQ